MMEILYHTFAPLQVMSWLKDIDLHSNTALEDSQNSIAKAVGALFQTRYSREKEKISSVIDVKAVFDEDSSTCRVYVCFEDDDQAVLFRITM